jgi:hypothetical protein
MKSPHFALLFAAVSAGPGCSLVTVPVKTAGGIVNTSVKTTGRVVEAPFKAVSGGYREESARPPAATPPSGTKTAAQE